MAVNKWVIFYLIYTEMHMSFAYCCFIALIAFHYMLFPLQCYVNHCLTYTACYHWDTTIARRNLIRWWKIIWTDCWSRMLQSSWKKVYLNWSQNLRVIYIALDITSVQYVYITQLMLNETKGDNAINTNKFIELKPTRT